MSNLDLAEKIKKNIKKLPKIKEILLLRSLYKHYKNENTVVSFLNFMIQNIGVVSVQSQEQNKVVQIEKLIKKVDILPLENKNFFYSIDYFKIAETQWRILDNCSIDYSKVVNHSFYELNSQLEKMSSQFAKNEKRMIEIMYSYLQRVKDNKKVSQVYEKAIQAIESLFERPANSFYEGLQRILFFNQFLWQTKHTLNGLGRLDQILISLYRSDLECGKINKSVAKELLKDFFFVLHENMCFKSSVLSGDTGQIIILGGINTNGEYEENELTRLFIEVSEELKLPDPKVLLRCSKQMSDDLLKKALECISTGIGAPLLSNDDVIIPRLISFGYDEEVAYNYVTAACWEPAVLNESCDQNNIDTLNFAIPLIEVLERIDLDSIKTYDDLFSWYKKYLKHYIQKKMESLIEIEFEEDPLISLLSDSAFQREKDITRGGAVYNNLGLTSVGLGTVVNSLLNLKQLVFETKEYSLKELNEYRKSNYTNRKEVWKKLKQCNIGYGCDDMEVIHLVNNITELTKKEVQKYKTKWNGTFKFGLSSPTYLTDGGKIPATFDGRRNGEPFSVHISSGTGVAPTELISFATKLDYTGNRINGNVIDFIVTPQFLSKNIEKFVLLLKAGIKNGIYQLQMNVIDSKTLIAAKKNPEKFPNLVVRVWGFSAYFKDLPEEYKDMLINRALESERVGC